MIRELAKSIREYKRASILAPVYVIGEVVMEAAHGVNGSPLHS